MLYSIFALFSLSSLREHGRNHQRQREPWNCRTGGHGGAGPFRDGDGLALGGSAHSVACESPFSLARETNGVADSKPDGRVRTGPLFSVVPESPRCRRLWSHDYRAHPYTVARDQFSRLTRAGWDPVIIADRLAVGLARARHIVTLPLARAAKRFIDGKGWFDFGYARIDDHARERFGRSGRWVRDLRSLAEATDRCPPLARAMTGEDGGPAIGPVVALAIGKVATQDSCEAWIGLARRLTVRELRDEIRKAQESGSPVPVASADPTSVLWQTTGRGGAAPAQHDGHAPAPEDQSQAAGEKRRQELAPDRSNPRFTARFAAPAPVAVAVEEARELHRAISGSETSSEEFIEALVADAFAGPFDIPGDETVTRRRPALAVREEALEEESHRWAVLRDPRWSAEVLPEAAQTLREAERLCREANAGGGDPDALIRDLVRIEDTLERRLGELLARMGEGGAWAGLRFAGVGHYAEERLGISRTQAQDRARLARDLRGRPSLQEALDEGRLGPEAAMLVVRALRPSRAGEEIEKNMDRPRGGDLDQAPSR